MNQLILYENFIWFVKRYSIIASLDVASAMMAASGNILDLFLVYF